LAQRHGATIQTDEKVLAYQAGADGVTVTTTQGTYSTEKLTLTTGPWLTDLLPSALHQPFAVYRQVFYWFEAEDLAPFGSDRFPFVIWIGDTPADFYTLFPTPPNGTPAVKMVTEEYLTPTHPEAVERTVQPHEIDHMVNHFIRNRVAGVTDHCLRATVCLYTVTPDEHFVIDWQPDRERVLIASPCSGHGFKHSAAIGEAMAQLIVDGTSELDLSSFRFERFGGS
jgi:sarcosine oxidase